MPEDVIEKLNPPLPDDTDIEQNAAGGPRQVPQVSINRSTVAELEGRRLQRMQTVSVTILAVAVMLCLIFVAKLILVVLLVSVLISFVLAPVVDFLVVQQVPRAVASGIAVALLVAAAMGATYVSYSRAIDFAHELPKYKSHIKGIVDKVRKQAEELEKTTEEVVPPAKDKSVPVTLTQSNDWADTLTRNAGAVSELALTITFVPFLVYFMLSWKDHVRTASVMLFSMEHRNTAYVMLGLISGMIRSFIVGNFIIGVFLSICSIAAFGLMGVPYFYFVGVVQRISQPHPVPGRNAGGDSAGVCRHRPPERFVDPHRIHDCDRAAPYRHECAVPEGAGQAAAVEPARANDLAAVLGMDVGRQRVDPGCSHHRCREDHLRPRGPLATIRDVAGRVATLHRLFSEFSPERS